MSWRNKIRTCHVKKKKDEKFDFFMKTDEGRRGQVLIDVAKNGPAHRGGLKNGDRVISINGTNVESKTLDEVISILMSGNANLEEMRFTVIDIHNDPNVNWQRRILASRNSRIRKNYVTRSQARICEIKKENNSFGFVLQCNDAGHGEKEHCVSSVDTGGPADKSGLKSGDIIIAVGKTNVENKSHAEVVKLMQKSGNKLSLMVTSQNRKPTSTPKTEESVIGFTSCTAVSNIGQMNAGPGGMLQPKLCHLIKQNCGYGFFLHEDSGLYIQRIVPGGSADIAGLRNGDRVIEVNFLNVESCSHQQVSQMILDSNEVSFLVVGEIEDRYFRENGIPIGTYLFEAATSETGTGSGYSSANDELNWNHMMETERESKDNTLEGKPSCVVCLTHPVNVFFRPCGHVCCCKNCCNELSNCPMCRRKIDEKLFAFV